MVTEPFVTSPEPDEIVSYCRRIIYEWADVTGDGTDATRLGPSAGGSLPRNRPCHWQRDKRKRAFNKVFGYLIAGGRWARGEATGKKERVINGGQKDCLSDALALLTGDDKDVVRAFIRGGTSSFDCAMDYVSHAHPSKCLVDVSSEMLNKTGGVELGLLNQKEGRFLLNMRYENAEGCSHCAFYDAAVEWGPMEDFDLESGQIIISAGRGGLFDNQADVPKNLAGASDRIDKDAARRFFAEPYAACLDMRITRVCELVTVEEGAQREEQRASALKAKRAALKAERDSRADLTDTCIDLTNIGLPALLDWIGAYDSKGNDLASRLQQEAVPKKKVLHTVERGMIEGGWRRLDEDQSTTPPPLHLDEIRSTTPPPRILSPCNTTFNRGEATVMEVNKKCIISATQGEWGPIFFHGSRKDPLPLTRDNLSIAIGDQYRPADQGGGACGLRSFGPGKKATRHAIKRQRDNLSSAMGQEHRPVAEGDGACDLRSFELDQRASKRQRTS